MATIVKQSTGGNIQLTVAVSSGITSDDPVLIGVSLTGFAITDRDSSGNAVVQFPYSTVIDINVEAVNNAGNSAVAIGDIIYYDSAATIKLNKDATNGIQYGIALETITSGSSDTINVLLTGV